MTKKKEPSRAMSIIFHFPTKKKKKKKKKTERVTTLTHATARVKLDTAHETDVNKVIETKYAVVRGEEKVSQNQFLQPTKVVCFERFCAQHRDTISRGL